MCPCRPKPGSTAQSRQWPQSPIAHKGDPNPPLPFPVTPQYHLHSSHHRNDDTGFEFVSYLAQSGHRLPGAAAPSAAPSATKTAVIHCNDVEHRIHSTLSSYTQGGRIPRPICISCNLPFVNDFRAEYFEHVEHEPLRPDTPPQPPSYQQPPVAIDPRQLLRDARPADSPFPSFSPPSDSASRTANHSIANSPDTSPPPPFPPTPPNTNVTTDRRAARTTLTPLRGFQALADPRTAALPARQHKTRKTGVASLFPCERGCNRSFPSRRERDRHHGTLRHAGAQPDWDSSVPSPGASPFQCACGKTDARRDNHRRHVKGCTGPRPGTPPVVFRCDRGHTLTAGGDTWLAHLDGADCKPRKGAPPRRTRP